MDIAYLLFLQNLREATGGIFNNFFAFITNVVVDFYILIPALILFWVKSKKEGVRVLLSWGTSICFNSILKTIFCVYRPWIRDARVKPLKDVISGATGYSFPSGHSSSASGFYSGLAFTYRKYKGLIIFSVVMVLLTMFSRNFVGVHTPQDVLVGASVGLLAAFIIAKVMDYIEENPSKDWIILLVGFVICAILLPFTYFKSYPMDYIDGVLLVDPKKMTVDGFKDPGMFFGIILGWFIEKRFINFSTEGTVYQKVMRSLVGALLVVLYYTVIIKVLGSAIGIGVVHFIFQVSLPVLFMCVYPMFFSRFKKASGS